MGLSKQRSHSQTALNHIVRGGTGTTATMRGGGIVVVARGGKVMRKEKIGKCGEEDIEHRNF